MHQKPNKKCRQLNLILFIGRLKPFHYTTEDRLYWVGIVILLAAFRLRMGGFSATEARPDEAVRAADCRYLCKPLIL